MTFSDVCCLFGYRLKAVCKVWMSLFKFVRLSKIIIIDIEMFTKALQMLEGGMFTQALQMLEVSIKQTSASGC